MIGMVADWKTVSGVAATMSNFPETSETRPIIAGPLIPATCFLQSFQSGPLS
jgi:hypothetical protein